VLQSATVVAAVTGPSMFVALHLALLRARLSPLTLLCCCGLLLSFSLPVSVLPPSSLASVALHPLAAALSSREQDVEAQLLLGLASFVFLQHGLSRVLEMSLFQLSLLGVLVALHHLTKDTSKA
jgi:hypothetical protein